MTTHWRPEHLALVTVSEQAALPKFDVEDLCPVVDGNYFWDQCPVLDSTGDVATHQDAELWLGLSAPVSADPAERHAQARLRLVWRRGSGWIDCGNLLPVGFCHGSREWAGMLYVVGSHGASLYYTAVGTASEQSPTYAQKIFEASATLVTDEAIPRFGNWVDRGEPIRADGNTYQVANDGDGEPGSIKSFRDPFYFRDPASGREYLLFSASDARARTERNAAIGVAVAKSYSGRWVMQKPIIVGDGVTNEMERPHVVCHSGCYYLFWSTHGWTIAEQIRAPTGLYGMVAESLRGPYEPLNGTGLVAANPIDRPYQAYSWLVANDLSVSSFVDMLDGEIKSGPGFPRYPVGKFEGTLAPEFRLQLDGARTRIAADQKVRLQ